MIISVASIETALVEKAVSKLYFLQFTIIGISTFLNEDFKRVRFQRLAYVIVYAFSFLSFFLLFFLKWRF